MTAYVNALKSILSPRLKDTRTKLKLSQDSMSERLHIASRSYIDLEHGNFLCSTCVFVFLLLLCEKGDVLRLLDEIRDAFDKLSRSDAAA